MSCKTLRAKIEYVTARHPDAGRSDTALALAVWRTFYPDLVHIDESGWTIALSVLNLRDIPSWDRIAATWRRMQRERSRSPTRETVRAEPAPPWWSDMS